MGTQKLCACDRTCQSAIRIDIEFIDTVKLPFAIIVKDLSEVNKEGLWLNPFRGIPRGSRLSRFDVVYLDDDCRVLEFAENFTEAEFKPFHGEAASALILPTHTIGSFHIQKADQLRICRGDQVLAGFDDSSSSEPNARSSQCAKQIESLASETQKRNHRKPVMSPVIASPDELEEKPSLRIRLLRWIFPPPPSTDRRRGERLPLPGLVAYYWTGGAPTSYRLGNVSNSGLYLLTEERWLPGTRIVMTLQKENRDEANSEEISRVESKVIRWGEDGVGCEFVESGFADMNTGEIVEDRKFDREAFEQFLCRVGNQHSGVQRTIIQ